MSERRAARGFTLLEALVVLVITGLVSVVLVQGFGLILAARTSAQNKLVAIDEAVVEANLFLEPLRGILPDYPNQPHIFSGEPQRLRGLTARPLQARPGAPTPFTLTIDYDASSNRSVLTYQEENAQPVALGSWEGSEGAFAYRDRTGEWQGVWPPQSDPQAPQTPWLIRLEKGSGFPRNMVASVSGAHQRTLRLMDGPFGMNASQP